jgi:chemotaxis methyl-accepting protein methylase
MDPGDFRQLLELLGYSWSGYRKVRRGVQRRIALHMKELSCPRIADYLERIYGDEAAHAECERRLTVSISRFFRDPPVWETLRDIVVPRLLERTAAPVRVWSAGCAGGEEIYSFEMTWRELGSRAGRVPALRALASDLSPENLARARRGVFGLGSLKNVPTAVREHWFQPLPGAQSFRIDPALQEGIAWTVHDLRERPPGTGFDILFLRNNVLTYYEPRLQRMALAQLLPALAPRGALVIGARERLPDESAGIEALPQCRSVYVKSS